MKILIFLFVLIGICIEAGVVSADNEPFIASWYGNHHAALSLRFDDALESHVKIAIPLLNQYDIKATFMVNPGRERYKKYREFWEKDVPLMGHKLGNHTMHHRGARDLEEAEYEIGESARIIRNSYPQESKLLVFASGGGKKWGGKYWKDASGKYKMIVDKYELIDLYDGMHPEVGVSAETSVEQLCSQIKNSGLERKHHALVFHNIGDKGLVEWIKSLLRSYDLTISQEKFHRILQCTDVARKEIWVAPLVQILKYEAERDSAQLDIIERNKGNIKMQLSIGTAPDLYDQKLTLVVPGKEDIGINRVVQDDKQISDFSHESGKILINVKPKDSDITVYFNQG